MKTSHVLTSVLGISCLVFAGHVQADMSKNKDHKTNLTSLSRVTQNSVDNRLTAKDLIGQAVYDQAGEKIGDIADIDVHTSLPDALAKSIDTSRDIASPGGAAAAMGSAGSATVFVSVGGLWGIGDDLVAVPASQLNFNAREKRFELQASKADVVALARGPDDRTYASDTMTGGSPTAAGKQSFSEEAMRVQKALRSDPQVSPFADRVMVTTDGENLEIRGVVDNDEQKDRILEAAKRSTSLDINDEIEVRE